MYNGEDIKKSRESISNNIVKGFSNSDDLFDKAHNHGDVHSNGKWYWESSANGGKGDWRTIKTTGKTTSSAAPKQSQSKVEDKISISVGDKFFYQKPGGGVQEWKVLYDDSKNKRLNNYTFSVNGDKDEIRIWETKDVIQAIKDKKLIRKRNYG